MIELLSFYKTPQYNLFENKGLCEKSKNNVSMSAEELELLMQNMGDFLYAYTHDQTTPSEEQSHETHSSTPPTI